MSIVSETRVFDEIVSTSLDLYRNKMEEQIFKENATLWALRRAGCYQPADGGVQIIEPLMYGDNETVASYSGYDTLDLTPQEGISATLWPWCQVAGSVVIDGMSEFKNAGKSQLVNLVAAKVMQLEMSFQAKFTYYMYRAGKYSASQATKDPAGLLSMVAEVPDNYDVGGIDTSVYTWWQNKVLGNGNTAFTWVDGAALATGVTAMDALNNNCTKKTGGSPNIGIASQALFQNYTGYLRTKQSLNALTDEQAVAAGFTNVKFRGMTLFWDEDFRTASCTVPGTTPALIYLNSKFIRIRYASSVNMKRTAWVTPQNQDARSCLILWYGNTTVSKRCKHGVLVDANVTNVV